ncbi:hypothetical protein SAMN05518669_103420 [Variovorax sp. YR634]|uniref:hypothetical protein n=1 Tax=Variovorax sp. YR634 TaxID=1884385 RepID=UPI000899490C|nr:hypothetical protein [Variovorax sp. YR634]SDX15523.1 hypothetical protein SAMN05518669_103420 [Variovorax sp. YR634]
MNLLDTSPDRVRAAQIQHVQMDLQRLVDYARAHGLVLTVWLESHQPPAMGGYDMRSEVREARHGAA